MANRNEFSVAIKAQIVARVLKANENQIVCEGCGLVLGKKPYQIDHTLPDGLRDKSAKPKKLTAGDGQLLGQECCHANKTRADVVQISKAIAQGKRNNGVKAKKAHIPAKPSAKNSDPDRNKRDPFPSLPRKSFYA